VEISQIAGLPAHPLIVHGAVVLVPLAALALLLTAWRRAWREAYALPIALLAWTGWGFSQLAAGSGEGLEHDLRGAARAAGVAAPRFGEHAELGETAAFLALLVAVAATALWAVDRLPGRWPQPHWLPGALYVTSAVVAVMGAGWMVQAGHTGADLAWSTNAGAAALLP